MADAPLLPEVESFLSQLNTDTHEAARPATDEALRPMLVQPQADPDVQEGQQETIGKAITGSIYKVDVVTSKPAEQVARVVELFREHGAPQAGIGAAGQTQQIEQIASERTSEYMKMLSADSNKDPALRGAIRSSFIADEIVRRLPMDDFNGGADFFVTQMIKRASKEDERAISAVAPKGGAPQTERDLMDPAIAKRAAAQQKIMFMPAADKADMIRYALSMRAAKRGSWGVVGEQEYTGPGAGGRQQGKAEGLPGERSKPRDADDVYTEEDISTFRDATGIVDPIGYLASQWDGFKFQLGARRLGFIPGDPAAPVPLNDTLMGEQPDSLLQIAPPTQLTKYAAAQVKQLNQEGLAQAEEDDKRAEFEKAAELQTKQVVEILGKSASQLEKPFEQWGVVEQAHGGTGQAEGAFRTVANLLGLATGGAEGAARVVADLKTVLPISSLGVKDMMTRGAQGRELGLFLARTNPLYEPNMDAKINSVWDGLGVAWKYMTHMAAPAAAKEKMQALKAQEPAWASMGPYEQEIARADALSSKNLFMSMDSVKAFEQSFGEWTARGATDKWSAADHAKLPLYAAGSAVVGLVSQVFDLQEHPHLLPFALAGGGLANRALEPILKSARLTPAWFDSVTAGANLRRIGKDIAFNRPDFVKTIQDGIVKAAAKSGEKGFAQSLEKLTARSTALLKTIEDGGKVTPRAASEWATAFANAAPRIRREVEGIAGLVDLAAPETSSFGWKGLRDIVGNLVARQPKQTYNLWWSKVNAAMGEGLEKRIVQRAMGSPGAFDKVKKLQDAYITAGAAERAQIRSTINELTLGAPEPKSAAETLGSLLDLEACHAKLEEIKGLPVRERRARTQEVLETRDLMTKLQGQISQDAHLDKLDQFALDKMAAIRRTPVSALASGMARIAYRITGKNSFQTFSELLGQPSLAENMTRFFAMEAGPLRLAKYTNDLRGMRLNHMYRYGESLLDQRIDALEFARTNQALGGGDVTQFAQQISALRSSRTQLQTEWRRAVTGPVDQGWTIEGKLLGELVQPEDMAHLIHDAPSIWGVVKKDAFMETTYKAPSTPWEKMMVDALDAKLALGQRAVTILSSEVDAAPGLVAKERALRRTVGSMQKVPVIKKITDAVNGATRSMDTRLLRHVVETMNDYMQTRTQIELGDVSRSSITTAEELSTIRARGADAKAAFLTKLGELPAEVKDVYKEILGAIPDEYMARPFSLSFEGRGGSWQAWGDVMKMEAPENYEAFIHENAHRLLSSVLDRKTVLRLHKIYQKEIEGSAAGLQGAQEISERLGIQKIEDKSFLENFEKFRGAPKNSHETLLAWDARARNVEANNVLTESAEVTSFMDKSLEQMMPSYWHNFTEWFAQKLERDLLSGISRTKKNRAEITLWNDVLDKSRKYTYSVWDQSGWRSLLMKRADDPQALNGFINGLRTGKWGMMNPDTTVFNNAAANNRVWMVQRMSGGFLGPDDFAKLDPITQLALSAEAGPAASIKTLMKTGEQLQKLADWVDAVQALNPARRKRMNAKIAELVRNERDLVDQKSSILSQETMRPDAALNMRRLLDWHPDQWIKDSVAQTESIAQTLKAGRSLGGQFDLLTAAALTPWEQMTAIRSMRRTAVGNVAVYSTMLEDLLRVYSKMTPEEQELISAGIGSGGVDSALTRNPSLRAALPSMDKKPGLYAQTVEHLDTWIKTESSAQAAMLEAAYESGHLSKELYDSMRTAGYSPHLYGIYERPNLVSSKAVREARRTRPSGSGEQGAGINAGLDESELAFQRDLAQWRVRVPEADGNIIDAKFDTEEAARTFVVDHFGQKALADMQKDGPMMVGRTTAGDRITLARPISDKEADVLDLLTGEVKPVQDPQTGLITSFKAIDRPNPVARIERFHRLAQDMNIHAFLNSSRASGLVLSEREYNQLFHGAILKKGVSGANVLAGDYIRLPQDARLFGNLGGNFVHRDLLGEVTSMSHTYDQLRGWVEAVQDLLVREGTAPGRKMLAGLIKEGGSVEQAWTAAVKSSQILLSPATWFANTTGNFLFSALTTGAEMMSPANWPIFAETMAEVFGINSSAARRLIGFASPADRLGLKTHSDHFFEAVRHGLATGSFLERSNNPTLRKAFVDLARLNDKPALRGRLRDLEAHHEELLGRNATGKPVDTVQLDIVATKEALRRLEPGYIRGLFQWFGGWLGARHKDIVGLPQNQMIDALRSLYGRVDDFFKIANYKILRRTMGPDAAAWRVRAFMQNYAEIPDSVRALERTPLGATVASFSWEALRIGTNALRFQAPRLGLMLGTIGALNEATAALAGVGEDRVRSVNAAMGLRGDTDNTVSKFTRFRIWDPLTKSLVVDLDFGNALMPVFNFARTNNGLKQTADELWPVETRTGAQELTAGLMGFAGSFVLNRPFFTSAVSLVTNKDPYTGRPLLPADGRQQSAATVSKALYKAIIQPLVPPLMLGGRAFTEIADAYQRPLSPDTGRPYGGPGTGTALVRGLTGVGIRGTPAYEISRALGGRDKAVVVDDRDILKSMLYYVQIGTRTWDPNQPLYSDMKVEKDMWAQMLSKENDPTKRAQLKADLAGRIAERTEVFKTPTGGDLIRKKDPYQVAMAMRYLEEKGIAKQFDRLNPVQQALVLTGCVDAQVHPDTVDELVAVLETGIPKMGRPQRPKPEANPYVLQDARKLLLDYLKEHPENAKQLTPVLEMWEYQEERALGLFNRAMEKKAALDEEAAEGE